MKEQSSGKISCPSHHYCEQAKKRRKKKKVLCHTSIFSLYLGSREELYNLDRKPGST